MEACYVSWVLLSCLYFQKTSSKGDGAVKGFCLSVLFFETGSPYIALAGLKRTM